MTWAVKSPIVDGKRQCTRCHVIKPLDEFYEKINPKRNSRRTAALYYAECKDCFKKRQRKQYRRAALGTAA